MYALASIHSLEHLLDEARGMETKSPGRFTGFSGAGLETRDHPRDTQRIRQEILNALLPVRDSAFLWANPLDEREIYEAKLFQAEQQDGHAPFWPRLAVAELRLSLCAQFDIGRDGLLARRAAIVAAHCHDD